MKRVQFTFSSSGDLRSESRMLRVVALSQVLFTWAWGDLSYIIFPFFFCFTFQFRFGLYRASYIHVLYTRMPFSAYRTCQQTRWYQEYRAKGLGIASPFWPSILKSEFRQQRKDMEANWKHIELKVQSANLNIIPHTGKGRDKSRHLSRQSCENSLPMGTLPKILRSFPFVLKLKMIFTPNYPNPSSCCIHYNQLNATCMIRIRATASPSYSCLSLANLYGVPAGFPFKLFRVVSNQVEMRWCKMHWTMLKKLKKNKNRKIRKIKSAEWSWTEVLEILFLRIPRYLRMHLYPCICSYILIHTIVL